MHQTLICRQAINATKGGGTLRIHTFYCRKGGYNGRIVNLRRLVQFTLTFPRLISFRPETPVPGRPAQGQRHKGKRYFVVDSLTPCAAIIPPKKRAHRRLSTGSSKGFNVKLSFGKRYINRWPQRGAGSQSGTNLLTYLPHTGAVNFAHGIAYKPLPGQDHTAYLVTGGDFVINLQQDVKGGTVGVGVNPLENLPDFRIKLLINRQDAIMRNSAARGPVTFSTDAIKASSSLIFSSMTKRRYNASTITCTAPKRIPRSPKMSLRNS